MRLSRLVALCIAVFPVALAAGCKKNESSSQSKAVKAPPTDALWALAPADTTVGVVAAAGTGPMLEGAWKEIQRSLGLHPEGKKAVARMQADMRGEVPPEVFDPAMRQQKGIDIARPAAMFVTRDEKWSMILPISDRAAFREAFGGKTETVDGVAVDVLEKARCKEIAGFYACADSDAVLATMGASKALQEQIARRPATMRGHIEVIVDGQVLTRAGDLPIGQFFRDIGAVDVAVQFARGSFTVRSHMHAKPAHPILQAFVAMPDDLSKRVAATKPAGIWRMRVPLSQLVPFDKLTRDMSPLVGVALSGIDLKADLFENLTGEIVVSSPTGASLGLELALGLADGKRLQPLVARLCTLGSGQIPTMKMDGDRCTAPIDPSALTGRPPMTGLPFEGPITLSLAVTDNALTAGVSAKGTGDTAGVPASEIGEDLISGSWNWAMWGYGNMAGFVAPPAVAAIKNSPDGDRALLALWGLAHITELAIGAGVRDDGVHTLFHVSTQWANPDEVLRPFQTHLTALVQGDAGAVAKLQALGQKAPNSPLGRSHKAGIGGLVAAYSSVGIAAAVAIPAFLKYIRKSKAVEARWMLKKMYDGARMSYMDPSIDPDNPSAPQAPGFPPESVGPTPALGQCCAQGEKCAPDAAQWDHPTWIALQFSVDDPHFFSYEYKVIDPAKEFVVRAYGDLDCDGQYSTYEMRGVVADGADGPPGRVELTVQNELE